MKWIKSSLLYTSVVLIFIIGSSQSNDPNSYNNSCLGITTNGGPNSAIDAYYNDPDGDCISNDWLLILYGRNGEITYLTSLNENCLELDWVDCYSTFDFNEWDCCTDDDEPPVSSNNNGGGGGNGSGNGGGGTTCLLDGCYTCIGSTDFSDCVLHCNSCQPL